MASEAISMMRLSLLMPCLVKAATTASAAPATPKALAFSNEALVLTSSQQRQSKAITCKVAVIEMRIR